MRNLFLGSKRFGLQMLKAISGESEWAIIHCDDTSDPRSCLDDFCDFAREKKFDLMVASTNSAANEMIQDVKPDIVFVCGWYWIIKDDVLDLASKGFFGIHNSLLPKYRGGAPLVWSIINGDEQIGSTLFRIQPGMDTGDIYHQVSVPLAKNEDIGDALRKIEAGFVSSLPNAWASICNGASGIPQDRSTATYCGQRRPEDGRIDWTKKAGDLHNFVRAQTTPYPGAFTFADNKRVAVLKTETFPMPYYGTPGQVLERSKGHAIVSCGHDTAISVLSTMIDGILVPPETAFSSINMRL